MGSITAVVAPKVCYDSAKRLADALGVRLLAPHQNLLGLRVFNYGSSDVVNARVNPGWAVAVCCDKIETLKRLTKGGVPCLEYATQKRKVPDEWGTVVVRKSIYGKQNEGMEYAYLPGKLPDAPLYTRWFDHRNEYRVVVFQGRVVGRYRKSFQPSGEWWLIPVSKRGFQDIDAACVKGAELLGIDYVGFDVLTKNKKDFRICEANSGPILTDDVLPQLVAALS